LRRGPTSVHRVWKGTLAIGEASVPFGRRVWKAAVFSSSFEGSDGAPVGNTHSLGGFENSISIATSRPKREHSISPSEAPCEGVMAYDPIFLQ